MGQGPCADLRGGNGHLSAGGVDGYVPGAQPAGQLVTIVFGGENQVGVMGKHLSDGADPETPGLRVIEIHPGEIHPGEIPVPRFGKVYRLRRIIGA